jgi:hypothetical protein
MNIQAILAIVFPAVTALIDLIGKIRAAAQQSDEWTPAMEAQFQDLLTATATLPHWQPDKPAQTP